ncbi:hypothetical protein [Candidatus Uabimicrobium sp. HlEnr_7]|uniref:hypothetical protein n=1 Tax=Candidatus Uabimicrobium helgolandensis TaxID=3095367 RepID=UPI0035581B6C
MAKKKKGMMRKLMTFVFVAFFICTIYFLHHFGIIAFGGSGGQGWGAAVVMPPTEEIRTFYFCDNTIYQGKKEISENEFSKIIERTKKKELSIDLYFVQEKITNEFHTNIKKMIDKVEVVFSEQKITFDKMPK